MRRWVCVCEKEGMRVLLWCGSGHASLVRACMHVCELSLFSLSLPNPITPQNDRCG